MQLEQIIGELLWRYNCVVVPGFGGFVTSRTPALIDPAKGIMLPPHKAVLFNRQLTNNDGLLTHSLAEKLQCSFDEAEVLVAEHIQEWHEKLMQGIRIQLDLVGTLFLDREQNICFEQDRFHNLLMDAYGLGQVRFVAEPKIETADSLAFEPEAIERVIPESRPEPVISIPNPVPTGKDEKQPKSTTTVKVNLAPIRKLPIRKAMKYVAAACILPIAFYSFWLPLKTDVLVSGVISWHDLNPFYEAPVKKTTEFNIDPVHTDHTEATSQEKLVALHSDDMPVQEVSTAPLSDAESAEINGVPVAENPPLEIPEEKTPVKTVVRSPEKKVEKTIEKPAIKKESKKREIPVTVPKPSASGKFQVIVGSFSNKLNAESLVSDLKKDGFQAYSFTQENGLIRVCAGKYASMEDAKAGMTNLSKIGRDSWILK